MTESMIIIKLYENIKIIYVDEAKLKKEDDIKSNDGYLEISLDDHTNDIYLILFYYSNETAEKNVLLNIKLSEFNFSNFVSLNRIAFKTNKLFDLTSFYTIEFVNSNDYFDIKSTLISLKEIYLCTSDRIESLSETDFFVNENRMDYEESQSIFIRPSAPVLDEDTIVANDDEKDYLCKKLQEAIAKGDVDNSMKYASQLAQIKANLYINVSKVPLEEPQTLQKENNIETSKENTNKTISSDNLCTIVLVFKNDNEKKRIFEIKSNATVLELKEKIWIDFNIPIEYQFLVVNDCSTNDDDLLEIYKNKACASSSTQAQSQVLNAHLFVFSKNLNEWNCSRCTFINTPDSDRCKMCQLEKDDEVVDFGPAKESVEFKIYTEQLQQKMKKKLLEKYNELATLAFLEINENTEPFDCDICLEKDIPPREGVILKECLHLFCKACLVNHINYWEDSIVKCPYAKEYNCMYNIQEREIRALLSPDEFKKFQLKSLRQSEASMKNSFHCKTPDCIGFCIHEDDLNFFECQVCEKVNCLRCNAIHMGKTCKEYQEDLKINAENDENSKKNIEALNELIKKNKAMHCPTCKIIVCKNEGCDWLVCPMCKTEICWATKGARWGPKGHGDNSGGCKCNLAQGKPCTPKCGNCH